MKSEFLVMEFAYERHTSLPSSIKVNMNEMETSGQLQLVCTDWIDTNPSNVPATLADANYFLTK
jgi:hypothetical protein